MNIPTPSSEPTATEAGATAPTGVAVMRLGAWLTGHGAVVDLLFAATLVTLALLGFRTGFLGWQWVLAAGAGLGLGLLVGHLGAVRRWPALTTTAVLVAVYFLLGGPFAVRDDLIAGVVPSWTTLTDLAAAAVAGWKRWLTLLPPVDARGPLLALPWMTGLVGGTLTYGVARRWRSAPVIVLVPLGLLAGSIALGTMQPAAKFLQGTVFALVLIGWVTVRAARGRAVVPSGSGTRVRALTAVGLLTVAALAGTFLGPYLPGATASDVRSVVRSELVPPYDVAQFTSPLAGFRRYTEPNPAELYDRTILTVTGLPAGTPLRFATLDRYDGLVWGAADRSSDGAAFQQVGSRIAPRTEGPSVTVQVGIPARGYAGVWLPTVGSPTAIGFAGPRARSLADALWLNVSTDTAVVPAQLGEGDRYTMTAILPRSAGLTTLPATLDVASGANAPPETSFLDAPVDAWSASASTPWQKFVAIARTMASNGAYTDGGTANSYEKVYLPGHSLARLGRFVGATQLAGNDEQYAATLALAGQRLGIPSRVVMGATPDGQGTVKGKDVHAWVEVQTRAGEWVALMPQTFLPDRNKKPNEQQLKSEQQKVGAQVPPPAGSNPPSVLQGPDQAQNATDIAKRRSLFDPSTWPMWLRILLFWVALPILVAVAAYLTIGWAKRRRRRRHASTGPVPSRAAWVWRDLVVDARTLGIAVPLRGATRLEQAALLDAAETVVAVAAGADAAVFGPGDPPPELATDLLARADEVRTAMRARATRWQRLRADLSLRPFLDRRPGPSGVRRRWALPHRAKAATS